MAVHGKLLAIVLSRAADCLRDSRDALISLTSLDHEISRDLFNPPVSFLLQSFDDFFCQFEHGSHVRKLMPCYGCGVNNLTAAGR